MHCGKSEKPVDAAAPGRKPCLRGVARDMPLERRRDSNIIAVLFGYLVGPGSGSPEAGPRLNAALERVNRLFAPALGEPFAAAGDGRVDGVLSDPAQTPLLISVTRESVAPLLLRIGVGVGTVEHLRDAPGGERDAYALAREALQLTARDDGLTRYLGTGDAGDVLLGALCRLVDPLVRSRTLKQWEAIAAYRELGHQREVAARLGVTRQSVGDRLAAGHRRAVEEADAAIATYLSYGARHHYGF